MGSVNSLSPGVEYTFEIEALDNSQAPLTSASLISSSGDVHLSLICSESGFNNNCGVCISWVKLLLSIVEKGGITFNNLKYTVIEE